jgi:putative SOS response-associated peptidase YedK
MFRTAFRRARRIVPASDYYEWETINGEHPTTGGTRPRRVRADAPLW